MLVIACLSLNGLAVLMGTGSWPVLLALLLSTAAVWGWRRVHRRAEQEPPVTREAPPVDDGVAAASLEAMSTSELCLAWRRSYRALMDAPCGKVHDDMVIMRRTMLDEFERRDPQGLRRWLDDDARASSDPGRYLSPPAGDI